MVPCSMTTSCNVWLHGTVARGVLLCNQMLHEPIHSPRRRRKGRAVALAPMQCDYFDAQRCRSCALMGVPYGVQLADKERHCAGVLFSVAPGVTWLPAFPSRESAF